MLPLKKRWLFEYNAYYDGNDERKYQYKNQGNEKLKNKSFALTFRSIVFRSKPLDDLPKHKPTNGSKCKIQSHIYHIMIKQKRALERI